MVVRCCSILEAGMIKHFYIEFLHGSYDVELVTEIPDKAKYVCSDEEHNIDLYMLNGKLYGKDE